jgi:hypothetical protein
VGTRDSSKTRVRPVFEFLLSTDPTGKSWLPTLLQLPRRFDGVLIEPPHDPGELVAHAWSPTEKRLAPPRSLLEWLVRNPPASGPKDLGTRSDEKRAKRERLIAGDEAIRAEALALLETRGKEDWHRFEGATSVDAYLATPELIVLIEGKRTERAPTTKTNWMPTRHQILRNIDAVWDERGSRSVAAFFIVQGRGPDATEVPSEWESFASLTTSPEVLKGSLPHRTPAEREAIASSFLGVTTWQAVCDAFVIPPESLPDEVPAEPTSAD